MEKLMEILPLLIPVLVLQFALQIYSLINLARRKKVRFDNKLIWVLIIIFGEILGAIIYLIFRGDEE